MTSGPLAGIVVPIPTLFDQRGRVDDEANARHIDWLIAGGVHGIFALGTTGEFTSLSPEERRAFAALAVRAARGRVPVLIGCGSPWTDEAIAYARHAQEAGAGGVVAVLPYYWLPSERSIYEHYRLLAEGVALPVYIYNFPALTGRSIAPRTVAALAAAHPNIAGLKDTVDSAAHIQETIALVKPERSEFSVLAGMDYHLLTPCSRGATGASRGPRISPRSRSYDSTPTRARGGWRRRPSATAPWPLSPGCFRSTRPRSWSSRKQWPRPG